MNVYFINTAFQTRYYKKSEDSLFDKNFQSTSTPQLIQLKAENKWWTNDPQPPKIDKDAKFTATVFGRTIDGKSIAVHLLEYKCCFWIKIPKIYIVRKQINKFKKQLIQIYKKNATYRNRKLRDFVTYDPNDVQFELCDYMDYTAGWNNNKKCRDART